MSTKKKKYRIDMTKRKRFQAPLFRKVTTYEVNPEEVEKYYKRNGRLPEHVYEVGGKE